MNTNKITNRHFRLITILGIEEARKGISNTATIDSILKGIGSKLTAMDITYEEVKAVCTAYDAGVTLAQEAK